MEEGLSWHWLTLRDGSSPPSPLFFCYSLHTPFFSLPAVCFNELDRFGQSDSHHCIAVGMNRMRGETHCHYSDDTLFPFFLSLSQWMFLSVVPVYLAVSLSGILLHVPPCLVDCVTLCCGLTKRVETWAKCGRSGYSGIWHVAMLLPLQKSFWLISCTVHQGFKEETQGDLRV